MGIFSVPYIPKDQIWDKVEAFRNQYERAQRIPVDILDLTEFDLGLELIPFEGLKRELGDVEAIISGDMLSIHVDKTNFIDPRYINRLRFSVAHELGHYILHQDIYADQNFDNVDDWKKWIGLIPEREYSIIESQAYEFAGRLLVNKDRLRSEWQKQKSKISDSIDLDNPELTDQIRASISVPIARVFVVSEAVITRRLRNEGIF